jgi:hypothetical protein
MATLKEIYNELDRILEDINDYIEETDSGNLASDMQKDVADPLESLVVALDNIIDDKTAGLYEEYEGDNFYEEDEDSW